MGTPFLTLTRLGPKFMNDAPVSTSHAVAVEKPAEILLTGGGRALFESDNPGTDLADRLGGGLLWFARLLTESA